MANSLVPTLRVSTGVITTVAWVRVAGNAAEDATRGVAIGPHGDVWTVAVRREQDPWSSVDPGSRVVVDRITSSGRLLWSHVLPSEDASWAAHVVVDDAGVAFVAGQRPNGAFLVAIDEGGSRKWYRAIGPDFDRPAGLALDASGHLWVQGQELARWHPSGKVVWHVSVGEGGSGPITFAVDASSDGAWVALAALGSASDRWVLVRYGFDGEPLAPEHLKGDGRAVGLAVGPDGHVWVLVENGGLLVVRVDPAKGPVWQTELATGQGDVLTPSGIAVDPHGTAWVVGTLLPGEATAAASSTYGSMAFIAGLSGDGTAVGFGLVGAGRSDTAYGVAAGESGDVVIVGASLWMLAGPDWPLGWSDGFVVMFCAEREERQC